MDRIRRKRLSLPSRPVSTPSLHALDTAVVASSADASPASSVDSSKADFLQSIVPRAIRSLSRSSTPRSPNQESPVSPAAASSRKLLQKSTSRASHHDSLGRRGSTSSEGYGRISRASTSVSGTSFNSIDWRSQAVDSHGPLESDPHLLRNRTGYLVTTAHHIIVLRNKADAIAAFPQLAAANARPGLPTALPEPLQLVPLQQVVAVFRAESSRPSFGIHVWWRSSYPAISFCDVQLFFGLPEERTAQMRCILRLVKATANELPDAPPLAAAEVEDAIKKMFKAEEPNYLGSEPEIFPVVCRSCPPAEGSSRPEDKPRRGPEGPSSFFVIGINLCFLVEISKASAVQEAPLEVKYQRFGLVTLESFRGHWLPHEQRFLLRFREPFKPPVTLELASRYYKRIILTLRKADKYLKPAWPTSWQLREIFQVVGLPETQPVVEREVFGSLQRTLTAFAAAYRCQPVDWEINWKTPLAPEFRVIPPSDGSTYSAVQLLAILRALRYNDYFMSLSFRDVDLSRLWGRYDSQRKGSVAYMNRSCLCLTGDESFILQRGPVLYQEFHALAFASETVRQMDLTNCLKTYPRRYGETTSSDVQFLSPILDLLRTGLSRCNRIILRGCALGQEDVRDLAGALSLELPGQGYNMTERTQPPVRLEALDVGKCGLSDADLKSLFDVLPNTGSSLQILDVAGNPGRVPAPLVSRFTRTMANMRRLSIAGSLMGTVDGALIPFETLCELDQLAVLDVSNTKLSMDSQHALEKYLLHLSARQAVAEREGSGGCELRLLVLDHCGVDGRAAARMLDAMTGLRSMHLSLNGNPLESGMDRLTSAIGLRCTGQLGLHMGMIDFREEDNYVRLIKALTVNKHITFLSLAGTAPTPTRDATCSNEMCEVLERFLELNKTIRYLDLSGYRGKLDEGQLGQGVGRCLRGLAHNKTLTHLRIRSQNLHEDIGAVGTAIQQNTSLRFLDCEDNNLNLTSVRYLTESLRQNGSIIDFRLGSAEKAQIMRQCLEDVTAPRPPKKKKKDHVDAAAEAQKQMLRTEVEKAFSQLQGYVRRNRDALEARTRRTVDVAESEETGNSRGWPSLGLKMSEGATPTDAVEAAAQRRVMVRSCSMPPDTAAQKPYRIRRDDDPFGGLLDGASPGSEDGTAPEPVDHDGGLATEEDEAPGGVDMGPKFDGAWSQLQLSGSVES